MEKTNNKGFANLTSKMDENVKSEMNAKIEGLSKKAKAAFNERCTEDYTKLSKLGSAQRINKLNSMIEDCGKEFPARAKKGEGVKERGTRQDNEFLNSRKKGIYQIDPKTMTLVAKHESIQSAHRATDKKVSDSSICYCANHRKGFKTAGGFRWEFAANCTIDANNVVTVNFTPEEAPAEVKAELNPDLVKAEAKPEVKPEVIEAVEIEVKADAKPEDVEVEDVDVEDAEDSNIK